MSAVRDVRIHRAARFHRLDADDLKQCQALAESIVAHQGGDLETETLRAINAFSNRPAVKEIHFDHFGALDVEEEGDDLGVNALRITGEHDDEEHLDDRLARQLNAALSNPALRVAQRQLNLLRRIAAGKISRVDLHNWKDRADEFSWIRETGGAA